MLASFTILFSPPRCLIKPSLPAYRENPSFPALSLFRILDAPCARFPALQMTHTAMASPPTSPQNFLSLKLPSRHDIYYEDHLSSYPTLTSVSRFPDSSNRGDFPFFLREPLSFFHKENSVVLSVLLSPPKSPPFSSIHAKLPHDLDPPFLDSEDPKSGQRPEFNATRTLPFPFSSAKTPPESLPLQYYQPMRPQVLVFSTLFIFAFFCDREKPPPI